MIRKDIRILQMLVQIYESTTIADMNVHSTVLLVSTYKFRSELMKLEKQLMQNCFSLLQIVENGPTRKI